MQLLTTWVHQFFVGWMEKQCHKILKTSVGFGKILVENQKLLNLQFLSRFQRKSSMQASFLNDVLRQQAFDCRLRHCRLKFSKIFGENPRPTIFSCNFLAFLADQIFVGTIERNLLTVEELRKGRRNRIDTSKEEMQSVSLEKI